MPTDSKNVFIIKSSYSALKEDVLCTKERGQVVLLGDFNARVEKSSELNDGNRYVCLVKENIMRVITG